LRAARKAERHSARPPTTRGTALWYSGGVPLLVQLALAGLLIADGARHNGSWMGMWGWFFLLLGVIPTTIINLIVTLFWYNEARWFLVLRGLVIALVLPVIILFGI
jgi:hypothetical protein